MKKYFQDYINYRIAKSKESLKDSRILAQSKNGKLFSDLMDWRQKGDYGDMFDFNQETVEPLIEQVEIFLETIESLIDKKGC